MNDNGGYVFSFKYVVKGIPQKNLRVALSEMYYCRGSKWGNNFDIPVAIQP